MIFSLSETSCFLSKQNNVVKHDSKNDNYVGRVRFKLIPGMFGFDRRRNWPVNRIKKNLDGWREFCAVVLNNTPAGGLSMAGVISTDVRLFGELHHRLILRLHQKYFIKQIINNFYLKNQWPPVRFVLQVPFHHQESLSHHIFKLSSFQHQ